MTVAITKTLENIATKSDFLPSDAPGAWQRANRQHYDRFFGDLEVGDVFAYSAAFLFQDVKALAEERGYKVATVPATQSRGKFACRVTATPKQKDNTMAPVSTIYGLYANSDMTEGRGPDILKATFVNEDDAWAIADTMSGVMGRRPDNGHWKGSEMSDVTVKPMALYPDIESYRSEKNGSERAAALAKLSPRERELLGIKG